MVDTLKIKALVVEKGKTQTGVATEMGLSKKVWYDRMKKKKFDSDEMYKLIHILDIKDPAPIFFADKVT